jgi:hypothetical protein
VLTAVDCKDFRIFGYSGNGNPFRGYALFNLENCRDYLLANICPMMKHAGSYGALGISSDPGTWFILKENQLSRDERIAIKGREYPAFFLMGDPAGLNH